MTPMYSAMILVIIGFGIVVLELFVPSAGILGIIAAICFVSGIISGFFHSLMLGTILLAITVISLPILFLILVKVWPSTPLGKRILIGKMRPEEVLPVGEAYEVKKLIGEKGTAKTKMLPSGIILIGDRSYDAVSDGFAIDKGQPIKVVAVKANRILVQPYDPKTEAADFDHDDVLSQSIEDLGIDPIDDPLG